MEKSENLKDKIKGISPEDIQKFNQLISGHRKLLLAIGRL